VEEMFTLYPTTCENAEYFSNLSISANLIEKKNINPFWSSKGPFYEKHKSGISWHHPFKLEKEAIY